jgi:hypothetical protein
LRTCSRKISHDRLLFPVCLEEVTSNTTPVLFSVLYRHLIILTTRKEVDRYADVHLVLRRIGQTFEPNLYHQLSCPYNTNISPFVFFFFFFNSRTATYRPTFPSLSGWERTTSTLSSVRKPSTTLSERPSCSPTRSSGI